MSTGLKKGDLLARGRTAEVYAWGNDRVLKIYLDRRAEGSAEYEAAITRAVHAAGIPVPAVDDLILLENRRGIIMERVSGPTMMQVLEKNPLRLRELARTLGDLHAGIHACRVSGLEPMRLKLWHAIARVSSIPMPVKQELMSLLVSLPDSDVVCHYDLHPMNVIMSPRGPVIIDWEGAGTGNPLLDIARSWFLMTRAYLPLKFPYHTIAVMIRNPFYREYLKQYRQSRVFDRRQFLKWRLLITAARLVEGVQEETQQLTAILNSALARKKPRFEA
jgi:uncharacterized protein (TIGR02172 family)